MGKPLEQCVFMHISLYVILPILSISLVTHNCQGPGPERIACQNNCLNCSCTGILAM